MKKIIKPLRKEESIYFSDFTGKPFDAFGPPVEVTFTFNYGSKYDTSSITFHLDDKDSSEILNVIKNKLSSDVKEEIKKQIKNLELNLSDSINSRDYYSCDYACNNIDFLKYIVNMNEDES